MSEDEVFLEWAKVNPYGSYSMYQTMLRLGEEKLQRQQVLYLKNKIVDDLVRQLNDLTRDVSMVASVIDYGHDEEYGEYGPLKMRIQFSDGLTFTFMEPEVERKNFESKP